MSMHTGILEKIALNIGTVGVPTKLSTLNGHCASGNYEITSKIEAAYISGVNYYAFLNRSLRNTIQMISVSIKSM